MDSHLQINFLIAFFHFDLPYFIAQNSHFENISSKQKKQLTDMLFAELPRVRLDRIRRPNKFLFDAHPTLSEVPEECEGYLDDGLDEISHSSDFQQRLELNTTLISPLGEFISTINHKIAWMGQKHAIKGRLFQNQNKNDLTKKLMLSRWSNETDKLRQRMKWKKIMHFDQVKHNRKKIIIMQWENNRHALNA